MVLLCLEPLAGHLVQHQLLLPSSLWAAVAAHGMALHARWICRHSAACPAS